ncbi:tRNA lysidine(34) synthetase TilS [Alteromonadaceae bacterium BrNp21-10]|nr:tRNA lysidine(34) synthetase TilS [Alteromonadaceae bacterium BrNp21-10]
MNNSIQMLLQQQLSISPRTIAVAYSGGVDSHVMLHALCQLRAQFPQHQYCAVHIHHGLSDNADDWLVHCQQTCVQLAIEFIGHKVLVNQGPRTSLEATARDARYQAIESLVPANSLVLLAQHQNDQLETVLLQLKRGAGPKGLSAMAGLKSASNGIEYARPLLALSRSQIEEYAQQQQLNWIEDESNSNEAFDRNFLRQQIIPSLLSRWPGMAKAVSRSAALCAEQQQLLDEVSHNHLMRIQDDQLRLNIHLLSELSSAWQAQVVRLWLSQQSIPMPPAAIIELLPKELLQTADDSHACLQWQQWQLRKYNGLLYVLTAPAEVELELISWQGQALFNIGENQPALLIDSNDNGGQLLQLATAAVDIQIGFGRLGTVFKPKGERHSKPLKKWMQLWQIPPWQRQQIPLVFVDGQLAMVMGYGVAEAFSQGQVNYWIKQDNCDITRK